MGENENDERREQDCEGMFGEDTQHSKRGTQGESRRQSSLKREEEQRSREIVDLGISVVNPQLDWRKEQQQCGEEPKSRNVDIDESRNSLERTALEVDSREESGLGSKRTEYEAT